MRGLPLPDWIILAVMVVVILLCIGYARTHPRRP